MSRPVRTSWSPGLRMSWPAKATWPPRYWRLSGSQFASARLRMVLPAPRSPSIPKISDVSRRKLMRSRIGADRGVTGPTVRSLTSRMSERSMSETSVDPVASFLERRSHQIDRRQRDGEKYPGDSGDPPSVDQIFAGIGDDAAKARCRRLDAEPEEAEDRLKDHHARNVEHRDKRDRRHEVGRRGQEQNA